MSDEKKNSVTGANTILRGNFTPKSADDGKLSVRQSVENEADRATSEFERQARAQIGGSIAFVTRLKDKNEDPLFFDEDD